MRLKGKVALVTGGGTGIGLSIATAFLQEGAQVVIAGRREEKLRTACEELKGPPPARHFQLDVRDEPRVREVVHSVLQEFGKIDILVNNAGVNVAERRIAKLTPEDWHALVDINATGTFNMIHAVLPSMRERKDGLVISVSSIAGCRPSLIGGAGYSAGKHAMAALTRVLSLEEKENGIRATVIYPGEVETPILDDRPVPVTAEHRAKILQPEDVAAAALLVATLPPRANIPELVIKPTTQVYT